MKEVKQNMNTETGDDKKKFFIWEINKQMLPYKIHFFLYVGAMGALLPYHPTIGITRLGLGAADLTLVFTVQQFLFIVFKPVIGYLTDYFNNLKGMIVALTVINAVLSYLLLVIPKVDDRSIPDRNNGFLFAQSDICKLCPISNELQLVVPYLPRESDIFRDEISCENGSLVQEIFATYCHKESSNSSFSFNITYEIEMYTRYESESASRRLKSNIGYYSHMNFSDIYITMYHHQQNISDLCIICPKTDNFAGFQDFNFTLEYISNSCFKYLPEKRPTKNVNFTRFSRHSNDVICNNPEQSAELENNEPNSFKRYQFWLYTLLMLTSCICTSCIFTLSDTACYESVQMIGADYGNQRAWGAIGWGLFAPFSGFLNDYSDSYWPAMIIMTVLCMLQIWNLSKIDLLKPQNSENILKDIRTVLSSAEFIAFDVGVLLNGMGIGTVWFFLAWFIAEMGGSRFLLGLAHTVQCFLGEMPLMFLSGWLIKKIGHFNVVSMSLVATCVRFLSYSFLRDPWLILPIECLDGITFGAFYAAMTSYGKLSAKPGTEATTQSLLCSTYEGLGAGLGCVISGMCFDNYGGSTTFFYAGLLFAAAAAINISSSLLLHFKKGSIEVSKETACENVRY